MPEYQQSIDNHYGRSNLCNIILEALKDAGKDIDSLTKEDLYSLVSESTPLLRRPITPPDEAVDPA